MNNMIPLLPFAKNDCGPVSLFEAEATLSTDGLLWVRYCVDAAPEAVVLPYGEDPVRTDGLWQSTCFEIFLRQAGALDYIEFNFAPSQQWAAYQFTGYRNGMSELPVSTPPEIHVDAGEYWFAVEASVELPAQFRGTDLTANITAVIEDVQGGLSYWAAKHAENKPDFHDPDCFVLPLSAKDAA